MIASSCCGLHTSGIIDAIVEPLCQGHRPIIEMTVERTRHETCPAGSYTRHRCRSCTRTEGGCGDVIRDSQDVAVIQVASRDMLACGISEHRGLNANRPIVQL